jgi:glutathione S-transferase
MHPMQAPIAVYGSVLSYYTGKLEGYLRYKRIPYRLVRWGVAEQLRTRRKTGAAQIPAVELPDGRWMTDTTPMIDWFEAHHPEPAVIPADPLQAFASRLVEDYAEEWLWRPAMHYRWSYRRDALLRSREIVQEMTAAIPLPGSIKRALMRLRQHGGYVKRDGVTPETWDHVESCYLGTLDALEAIFASRSFLLGDAPTLADFGFFASMFRHFSQDPTPAAIMRERAPGVFEWQARLWNARASNTGDRLEDGIPEDWGPILDRIGSQYLPYLCANAEAWKAGARRHDVEIENVRYRALPVSQYRVWCLERLRQHYGGLPDDPKSRARALLEKHGCFEPLFRVDNPDSRYDDSAVPFRGRKVHYHNARR